MKEQTKSEIIYSNFLGAMEKNRERYEQLSNNFKPTEQFKRAAIKVMFNSKESYERQAMFFQK